MTFHKTLKIQTYRGLTEVKNDLSIASNNSHLFISVTVQAVFNSALQLKIQSNAAPIVISIKEIESSLLQTLRL